MIQTKALGNRLLASPAAHGNMTLMKISSVVSTAVFLLLTACSLMQNMESPPSSPSPRPTLPQSTLVATVSRDVHTVSTASPAPTATQIAFDCNTPSSTTITNYVISADMQYAKRELKVAQSITYTNTDDLPLSTIVLNVRSNWQPGIFKLQSLELSSGVQLKSHLTGQRLEITLPQPLNQGCVAHINLQIDLHIPPIDIGGIHAYQGFLGYTSRQTNIGQWLPVVAPRDGEAWISHEEIPIGEQDALEVANWDIHFRMLGAPSIVQIAAPGTSEQIDDHEWHFTLQEARDFSFSIGENYRLLQQKTTSGINVELYCFDDTLIPNDNGSVDSAAYALNVAVKSLNLYETVYGAYPLQRLVIVEGDFPDGMEFSGIVFVGGEYFRGLTGVQSYLTIITAHEVSHQWWYSRVGNDQAIAPWLDEALATYSEVIFIEKYYPTLKEWWWDFRVNRLAPQGFVDSTVYEFSSRRAYINAVYLRGVQMLNDLRSELGDDTFFSWLNRYASEGAGRIMTSGLFWSLLTPDQYTRTALTRKKYLHQPELVVLVRSTCNSQATCTPE
jgi:hypothetical protein